jgi:hypothetical protein
MEVRLPQAGTNLPGLLQASLLVLLGAVILRAAWLQARRRGLLTSAFWQSFFEFAPYRVKRLGSLVLGALGAFLLIWGAGLLYGWVRAYYAARLGHFGP